MSTPRLISSGIQKLFIAWRYQSLTHSYFILLKSFRFVVFPPIIRRSSTSVSPKGLNSGFFFNWLIKLFLPENQLRTNNGAKGERSDARQVEPRSGRGSGVFTKRPACRQPGRGAHQASSITSGLGAVPTKRVPQRSEDCLSDWALPPAPSHRWNPATGHRTPAAVAQVELSD